MTQEEKQQKAYEVYPLDLDRHFIIEGEPYAIYREMLHARVVHEDIDNVYKSPTLRCDGVDIPKITIKEK